MTSTPSTAQGGFIMAVLLGLLAVLAGGAFILDRVSGRQSAAKHDQQSEDGRHENMSALAVANAAMSTALYTTPSTQVTGVTNTWKVPQFQRSVLLDANLQMSLDPTAKPSSAWQLDSGKNQLVVSLTDPDASPAGAAGPKEKVTVEPMPGTAEILTLENGVTTVGSVVFKATSQVTDPRSKTTRPVTTKARINIDLPTDPSCWVELVNPKPLYQIGETITARVMGRHGFFGYAEMTPQGDGPIQTMSLDDPAQLAQMSYLGTHAIGAPTIQFPAPPPPDDTLYPFPPYYWYPKGAPPVLEQFYYYGLDPTAAKQGYQKLLLTGTATLAAHTGTGIAAGTTLQCTPAVMPVNVRYNPPKPCTCSAPFVMTKQINDSCVCQYVYPVPGVGGLGITLTAAAEPHLKKYTAGSRLVGCFASGTHIRMADGTDRAIETLTDSDIVLNPLTGRQTEIKRLVAGPEAQPLYEVTTDDGKVVRVTSGHPFLTPRGLVRAADLRPEDGLRARRLSAPPTEKVWNLELDADSDAAVDHAVLADGVVTGDLFLQEGLTP